MANDINAVLKRIDGLEDALLGSVSGPGILAKMTSEQNQKHYENTKRIEAIEIDIRWAIRLAKVAIWCIVVMAFLSGSGVVTLDHALKIFELIK